jgi:hypothetical protein
MSNEISISTAVAYIVTTAFVVFIGFKSFPYSTLVNNSIQDLSKEHVETHELLQFDLSSMQAP